MEIIQEAKKMFCKASEKGDHHQWEWSKLSDDGINPEFNKKSKSGDDSRIFTEIGFVLSGISICLYTHIAK